MAGLPEDREFLDGLRSFSKQKREEAFPSQQFLGDFRRRFVSLKKELENLVEENSALQRQFSAMQVQKSCQQFPMKQSPQPTEFRQLLNQHVGENVKLHEKVITLLADNDVLKKEIQDLKNQLEKHEGMASLCGGIGSVNMRNDHLSKKMEDKELCLDELLRKLEEKERLEIAVLNHKVNVLNVQLEEIQRTNVQIMQAAELQALVKDVQTEIGKLREELRILKSIGERKVEERDRHQTQKLDDYEKQIEELKIELKERSLQRAALIDQEKVLKEKVQRIKETNEELTIQIGELQAQLLAKEREVYELIKKENRIRNANEKILEEKDGLNEKLNEYKKQIAELKIKLEEKSAERAAMLGQMNTLNEKLQLMKKTNDECGIQIGILQTHIMDKEREVYELREENNRVESNAEKEIKNLKDHAQELKKKNERLRHQYERGCGRAMDHLIDQIIELKLDNKVINNMKIDKLKENEKLQGIIAEKNKEISRQKQEIDDLRAEIRDLKNDILKRTTKEVEPQGDGLHDHIVTPQLDRNLQDEVITKKPKQQEENPLESEAEEETKSSEDLQDSGKPRRKWRNKIVESLGKGLK
ncbi:interaptin-like [Palaemon carinicauda]|uniref:interaptin-like n=1 Tax=Palaemon carinicauda TaxID=392227 RepID=UPI0035B63CC2